MPRPLLLPAMIAMSLAACMPAPSPASSPAPPAPAVASIAPGTVATSEPVSTAISTAPPGAAPADPVAAPSASVIAGAIRDGNRSLPALRVCAHPVGGGSPACIDTATGAAAYRIEVAAGRYVVTGQTLGEPTLEFAHAERIRCIRAPCPPDTAIVVDVAAGEVTSGIDLTVGEALPPG